MNTIFEIILFASMICLMFVINQKSMSMRPKGITPAEWAQIQKSEREAREEELLVQRIIEQTRLEAERQARPQHVEVTRPVAVAQPAIENYKAQIKGHLEAMLWKQHLEEDPVTKVKTKKYTYEKLREQFADPNAMKQAIDLIDQWVNAIYREQYRNQPREIDGKAYDLDGQWFKLPKEFRVAGCNFIQLPVLLQMTKKGLASNLCLPYCTFAAAQLLRRKSLLDFNVLNDHLVPMLYGCAWSVLQRAAGAGDTDETFKELRTMGLNGLIITLNGLQPTQDLFDDLMLHVWGISGENFISLALAEGIIMPSDDKLTEMVFEGKKIPHFGRFRAGRPLIINYLLEGHFILVHASRGRSGQFSFEIIDPVGQDLSSELFTEGLAALCTYIKDQLRQ